jgi:hypothetical protein
MAMGSRRWHAKQALMWVTTRDLPRSAADPFYARLNEILDQHDFDCANVHLGPEDQYLHTQAGYTTASDPMETI